MRTQRPEEGTSQAYHSDPLVLGTHTRAHFKRSDLGLCHMRLLKIEFELEHITLRLKFTERQ